MTDELPFNEFLSRIRAGDADAAAELVRRFEPVIRMEVKMRLADQRLRRVFDSMDICQSVLGSFFIRAAAGQYDLNDASSLVRLLVKITRNKVAYQARLEHSPRRDSRRNVTIDAGSDGELPAITDPSPTPCHVAASRELLGEFRRRLSREEQRLADLRGEGRDWGEVAGLLGGSAEACRKQLARAVARVARELDIDR